MTSSRTATNTAALDGEATAWLDRAEAIAEARGLALVTSGVDGLRGA